VRVRAAGICSTDVHTVQAGATPPVTLGHELSGVLEDGTGVAIEPMAPCGACPECVAGVYHVCRGNAAGHPGASYLGFAYDGGYAEEVLVPERSLVALPTGLAVRDACVIEPVAVALHGLRIAGMVPGSRVAVIGAGAIGLGAVACAVAAGCEVGLAARHPHQHEAGERLGAVGLAGEYDVVVDAAGSREAVAEAALIARPARSTILFLALHYGDIPLTGTTALARELRTVTSLGYGHDGAGRDIDAAAALVGANPEIPRSLITHRFALEDAPAAFRAASDRKAGAIRVVLEP
jgi:threonine dehydrogenase-like Zn-dependent dehydrogenase